MTATSTRDGGVPIIVLVTTIVFILLGSFASELLGNCEAVLVLGLMLLIGLPHGATDHGLFLALTRRKPMAKQVNFYLLYALVIAAYGLLWYLLPVIAFIIFMLLSVYHFGQSNWVDVSYRSNSFARMHYVLWGCGILLTPILLHGEEATFIVAEMTDRLLALPAYSSRLIAIGLLAFLNLFFLLLCWYKNLIDGYRLGKEIVGYSLLIIMFFTNSLLLGFTVYFVFWHSLASAKDQWLFFRPRLSSEVWRQLRLGILTTVTGALVFCLFLWFGPGPETALRPGVIGGVFLFISLLTLPHMLLVETLYAHWSPASGHEKIPTGFYQKDHKNHTSTLGKETVTFPG